MSLNKVILIGNVGRDPEVRHFDNGNAVANFSVATSERGYRTSNGTEVPERTDWHRIVVTRDRVNFVEQYVKKGSMVYVEGKLRNREYTDNSGVKHNVSEIYAERIEFFNTGRRPDGATGQQQTNASATSTADVQVPDMPVGAADGGDDLPF